MEREQLINNIIDLEWEMFTNAASADGRASCQDDKVTFTIMRKAQAGIWSENTLSSYLYDLEEAAQNKINLMTIKYAHMMKIIKPWWIHWELVKSTFAMRFMMNMKTSDINSRLYHPGLRNLLRKL